MEVEAGELGDATGIEPHDARAQQAGPVEAPQGRAIMPEYHLERVGRGCLRASSRPNVCANGQGATPLSTIDAEQIGLEERGTCGRAPF